MARHKGSRHHAGKSSKSGSSMQGQGSSNRMQHSISSELDDSSEDNQMYGSEKGDDKIESLHERLTATREQIDQTVSQIMEKVRSREMWTDLFSMFFSNDERLRQMREEMFQSIGNFSRSAVYKVRNSPVKSIIAGTGLAYLFYDLSKDDSKTRKLIDGNVVKAARKAGRKLRAATQMLDRSA